MSKDDKDATRRRYYEGAAREQVHRTNRDKKQKARKRGELPPPQKSARRRDWNDADDEGLSSRETMRPRKAPVNDSGSEREAVDRSAANALVVTVDRSGLLVSYQGEIIKATTTVPVAVGDEVELIEIDGTLPRVVGRAPRRSILSRPAPDNPERVKVLAANVDIAVCVLSIRRPALRLGLVDRFLVACALGEVETILVVNKVDLCQSSAEVQELEAAVTRFRRLGTPVFLTSTATGEQIEELGRALAGKTCVLAGHSGVGKSSLLNALDPLGCRKTGRLREGDGKGRHTTVRSSLVELADGTRLIDTPGVRAFGLARINPAELRFYFPDLDSLGRSCRFNDCLHREEPDCAVREAVASGEIDPQRLDSYLRLLADLE